MSRAIKGGRGGTIHLLQKGETANPNGRPRKWVSALAAQGYKKSEITDAIKALLSMTLDELDEVYSGEENTILERTVAVSLAESIKKKDLNALETLISRIYGKPEQGVTHNQEEEKVKRIIKIGDQKIEWG